jgi:hypothetical protein
MMDRIRASLIFDRVVVWDNSVQPDWKCAGRYMAAMLAATDLVYWQDDDVIVPRETQETLLSEYEAPIVANWGHGENPDGYDDLPLVCGGAIASSSEAWYAISHYANEYPLDQEFMYEADFVVGVLYTRFKHVHLPFEINMPVAQHPSRLVNQPWQRATKHRITERARAIRDRELTTA